MPSKAPPSIVRSLSIRFALITGLLLSVVGGALYLALQHKLEGRDQEELVSRIELIRYYLKDDATIDVLTSTQEYSLPSDFVETVWLELGTAMLDNLDQLRTRTDQSTWRQQAAGTPISFYTYGLMLGLVPKPNAAAAALTLTLRYVATPTWDATNGFEKLATDHHHIPVYRAAQLYFEAVGYDQHFARAERFRSIWETECERVREYYAHRMQERGAR